MSDTTLEQRKPNPVDLHVGGRIRMKRKIMGISQEKLAGALHLTFQQVQKYERGSNRVSASKLHQIAAFLGTSVSYFFEGLPDPEKQMGVSENGPERFVHDFLMTHEGLQLAANFPKIKQRAVRRKVLDLVRSLAGEDAEAETEPA